MKILLAVDGSPDSDAAVAEVCRRPWPESSEVLVVTVDQPMAPSFFRGASPTAFDEIVRQQRANAVKIVTDALTTVKANTAIRATSRVLEGSPKDAILDEAERWGAELIVLGSQGHSRLRRVFLGSVSLAVATGARCSVEIVRVRAPSVASETPL